MVWTGGFSPVFRGVRTFELRACDDGSTDFVMEERFSGLMLPFVRSSMPDFGPVFERYASDLKREAELRRPSPRRGGRTRRGIALETTSRGLVADRDRRVTFSLVPVRDT